MTAEAVMEMVGCASIFVPVGVITVGLSTLVLIFPGFGHFTLYAFRASAPIVNYVSCIISWIIGLNIQTNRLRIQ